MNQSPSTTTVPASSPLRESSVPPSNRCAQTRRWHSRSRTSSPSTLWPTRSSPRRHRRDELPTRRRDRYRGDQREPPTSTWARCCRSTRTRSARSPRRCTRAPPLSARPVAAGLGATRTRILDGMRDVPPTVVANASEDPHARIDVNPGARRPRRRRCKRMGRPAESTDDVDTAARAPNVWPCTGVPRTYTRACAQMAVSGETDLSPTASARRLPGGDPMMTKITGAGCAWAARW